MRESIKRISIMSSLLAFAIVLNIIEIMVPVLPVPGAKIGLSNIITLYVLYSFGYKESIFLLFSRVICVSIITGTLFGIIFYLGLLGGLFAINSMIILKKMNFFGVIGVSLIGSVFHNLGQVIAAALIVESVEVVLYLPIMLLTSVPSGYFIGIVAKELLIRSKKTSIIWFVTLDTSSRICYNNACETYYDNRHSERRNTWKKMFIQKHV